MDLAASVIGRNLLLTLDRHSSSATLLVSGGVFSLSPSPPHPLLLALARCVHSFRQPMQPIS